MAHAVVVRGELNGLGVIRSLAKGGVSTVLVDTTKLRAGAWSRFCRFETVASLHGPAFVDALLKLAHKLGDRPVLILTDEMSVLTVSEHRDAVSAAYRIQLPAPDVVSLLIDKARFQTFAEANGLPVPRTAIVANEQSLAALKPLRFPVIVKPADKRPVYLNQTDRLHTAQSLAECEALCRRLLATAGEVVVQEWIDGPDRDIFFTLFHQGRRPDALTMFSGRKIVCDPPKVGSTAFCTAAPEVAEELETLTRELIRLSGYQGLGSVEFKYDAVAHRFVIIEPTVGRTDWQEEIATLSGVNIPLAAYRDAMDLPPLMPAPPREPVAWQASWLHWRGRAELNSPARVYDGYWRTNDPAPALIYYGQAAARRLSRLLFGRGFPSASSKLPST